MVIVRHDDNNSWDSLI